MVVSDLLGSHVPQCMITPEHGRSVQMEACLCYRGVTSSRHGLGQQGCGQLIVSDAVILEGWRSRSGWMGMQHISSRLSTTWWSDDAGNKL